MGVVMIDLFIVAALAAQADLPAAAADTVEVEVSADAIVKVPAQGYRVNAFFGMPRNTAAPKPSDLDALKSQLARLEMPPRNVCTPSFPTGFVGNEAYDSGDPDDSAEAAAATANMPTTAQPPEPYTGMFSTKASAEQAVQLLRAAGRTAVSMTPVLFDCENAVKQAQLQALAKARQQIQPIADALGLRVRGFTRVEFNGGETTVEFALAAMTTAFSKERDVVEMPASAKVEFVLGK